LLAKVEEAIKSLKRRGKPITQQHIANMVGKSTDTLLKYTRVRDVLLRYTKIQQLYIKNLEKNHENQYIEKNKNAMSSEKELLLEVKVVMEQLEASQKIISIRAVCAAIGISPSYLYFWPSVISIVRESIQRTKSEALALQFQQREEELVRSVTEAVQQLQSDGQRVSVGAIARLVHLSQAALYRYPKVRVILEDIAKKWQHRKVVEPS
jgi:Family of unknown function (DUF6262)